MSFFFLNQVVLGLGLGLGLGKGYLGLWLVSTPPHPFLKRGWALNCVVRVGVCVFERMLFQG